MPLWGRLMSPLSGRAAASDPEGLKPFEEDTIDLRFVLPVARQGSFGSGLRVVERVEQDGVRADDLLKGIVVVAQDELVGPSVRAGTGLRSRRNRRVRRSWRITASRTESSWPTCPSMIPSGRAMCTSDR